MAKEHPPATREQAKYVAIRVGHCDPYCVLPIKSLSGECLGCGNLIAQGEGAYEFTAWPIPLGPDWTCEAGRSNSSRAFRIVAARINGIIRESGHDLIRGCSERVAQLITAQLAHVEKMGGPGTMLDPNERAAAIRVADRLSRTPVHAAERADLDLVCSILTRLTR